MTKYNTAPSKCRNKTTSTQTNFSVPWMPGVHERVDQHPDPKNRSRNGQNDADDSEAEDGGEHGVHDFLMDELTVTQ